MSNGEYSIKDGKKKCRKCKQIKSTDAFYFDGKTSDYLNTRCRDCVRAGGRKSYQTHGKSQYLESRYGATLTTREQLLDSQNQQCAICKIDITDSSCLDHCHETGTIRGLLCRECNLALGHFKDDISILKAAISYLEESK